jgi:hypothetical protein
MFDEFYHENTNNIMATRVGISKRNSPSNLTVLTTPLPIFTDLRKNVDGYQEFLTVFDGQFAHFSRQIPSLMATMPNHKNSMKLQISNDPFPLNTPGCYLQDGIKVLWHILAAVQDDQSTTSEIELTPISNRTPVPAIHSS